MNTQIVNTKSRPKYEARAAVIKALAHPARLMIVDELFEHRQRCVCELTELVGTDLCIGATLALFLQASAGTDPGPYLPRWLAVAPVG